MNRLLLIIDVQNDFVNEHTKNTLIKIKELVDLNKYDLTAFTRFINDKNSIWYKKLNYKGCMTKNGQSIAIDLFEQNYDVYVLKDYCMSHAGKEIHDLYITNLARLIGKDKII